MFRKFRQILISPHFLILIVPVLFLIIGIATIPDYGINWDSFVHFSRGQSYLNFFLTGKKNYNDFPPLVYSNCISGNLGLLLPSCPGGGFRRSYYQNDYYNYEFWVVNDSGHPPVNDILAALSNYLFYQKLGILGDNVSHHLFILFTSFLLIIGIAYFVCQELGTFPAIVSSIVLASYPLFFSESHFNIKDPPEASFFGLAIMFFYLGVVKNKWKFILISSIAAGLALGTKLNIIFAAVIVVPWIVFYLINKFSPNFSITKVAQFLNDRRMLLLSFVVYLPISLGIVYIFWPYLWQDPARNTFNILGYYTQIGIGTPAEMSKYILYGWNIYPAYWISVTTTLPVLVLSVVGILSFWLFARLRKMEFYLFAILWLFVSIVRVSWPNADIYGGVRQIMEYVPALAILSGVGTYTLLRFRFRKVSLALIVVGLFFSIFEMVKIHPNENIYFNQLVGGLKGAQLKNIPYWGNTYGSVYLQGVKWINENSEIEAKIALPLGVMSNISRTMFRSDLHYSKPNWSGPNREGEYGIEMYFEWPMKYWYSFQYYDKYLEPVYVYSVDGVPILKVWKNDMEHTKSIFKEEISYLPKFTSIDKNILGSALNIDLGKNVFITKLVVHHAKNGCQNGSLGYIALSSDKKVWQQQIDPITSPQVAPNVDEKIIGWNDTNFVYLFAGKNTRYIMLDPQIENSCLLKNFEVNVYGLKTLP